MADVWRRALVAGVGDAVFWGSTFVEVSKLMKEYAERRNDDQRAAIERAGIVAAAVYNVNRKKGARWIKPSDFIATRPHEVTPEQFATLMKGWARSHNRTVQ